MTNEPLKQTPLSVRMADRLQADILAGVWTGVLPGYRVLVERYETSFRTALAALKTLEQRKVLEPATQGNRRGVKKCGPVKAEAGDASLGTLLLLYASDFPISAQTWSTAPSVASIRSDYTAG